MPRKDTSSAITRTSNGRDLDAQCDDGDAGDDDDDVDDDVLPVPSLLPATVLVPSPCACAAMKIGTTRCRRTWPMLFHNTFSGRWSRRSEGEERSSDRVPPPAAHPWRSVLAFTTAPF